MEKVIIGSDTIVNNTVAKENLDFIAAQIQAAGFEVENVGVDPNTVQSAGLDESRSSGAYGVMLIGGIGPETVGDFLTGMDCRGTQGGKYYHFKKMIFGAEWWIWESSCEEAFNFKANEWDWNRGPAMAEYNNKSFNEVADLAGRDCVDGACGKSKEELAQEIIKKLNGVPGNVVQGGSGVYWPDKTFWGLLRQITGAVDAIFIIANNMAYMLSFKDYYSYRDRYEEFIPELPANHIINNTIEKNWSTEGFYNTVVVDYNGGRIQYEYEPLVKQYGRQPFFYEFPDDDEETAKAKADALLGAHIRDYSLDIHLTCIYNKQITVGSWVKIPKKITKINYERVIPALGGTNPDGEEKKQANEKSDEIELEYDLLFVQGYYVRWTSQKSLLMDLHLKYAPDTPEDPINATVGGGGIAMTGQFGNDCFDGHSICVANAEKIYGRYSGGAHVQDVKTLVNGQYQPTSEQMAPRAGQGTSYAKALAGKTPQEAYQYFRSTCLYCYYGGFCTKVTDCVSVFWDKILSQEIRGGNCGDQMKILKCFFDVTGTPSCGIHIDWHYFNAIQLNGTWEIIDGVRIDNQTCGFPDGSSAAYWSMSSNPACSPCGGPNYQTE